MKVGKGERGGSVQVGKDVKAGKTPGGEEKGRGQGVQG